MERIIFNKDCFPENEPITMLYVHAYNRLKLNLLDVFSNITQPINRSIYHSAFVKFENGEIVYYYLDHPPLKFLDNHLETSYNKTFGDLS